MVKIISDSTCDLSKDLLEKYDVEILPLHVILDDRDYQDGLTITPDEIYCWSDASKQTPKTSAISVDEAAEVFAPLIKEGHEVVCFAISGSMSSTVNSMRMAAEMLNAEDRITVIDSASLSTGVGLQVIEAAKMAKEGKSAKEIAAAIEAIKPLVRASFVVDTLTYLHRGGRVSTASAIVGNHV